VTTSQALKTNTRFPDALDRIRAHCERLIEATGVPGFAIAITDRTETLATLEIGPANVDAGTPITPGTLFETGSIDKVITAALLMQLVDEQKLDLRAPVREYLPWFEVGGDRPPITTHHLLTHTAGIFNGMDHSPDAASEAWSLRFTKPAIDPGEEPGYSNLGYKVLGLMLEHLTGKSYQALVRERIFEPLGIRDSHPAITNAMRDQLAVGYVPRLGDRPWQVEHGFVPATWLETGSADGCLAMTSGDLATWLRALLNEGAGPEGAVLTREQFRRMTEAEAGDDESWYGYGIERARDDRQNLIGHDGDMVGYTSAMLGDLMIGVGVVVFCNATEPFLPTPVAEYALEMLQAVVRNADLPPEPEIETGERIPNAESYIGTYGAGDDQVTIFRAGDGLTMEIDGRQVALARLPFSSDPDVMVLKDAELSRFPPRFGRNDAGEIVDCWMGDRWIPGTGYDGPTTFDVPEEWRACPGHYRSHIPWDAGFRVVLRKGQLWRIRYDGVDFPLVPEGDGFRVGGADSPAWLRFTDIADGKALRLVYENGAEFYRFFLP